MAILVNVRQKAAVVFRSLVEANAAEIGKALEHRLREFLEEGETLPDVRLVLVLLGRMVAAAAARLVRDQREHEYELGAGVVTRARRDTAAEVLRRRLVNVRALVAAFFGRRRGSEILGLEGGTAEATRPNLLCRQAGTAANCLRKPELEVPGTKLHLVLDPVVLAGDLEPDVEALSQALIDVERGERRARRTLAAKEEAMAELDFVQRASVSVMKGFFTLAGRSDLARQIGGLPRQKNSPDPLSFKGGQEKKKGGA